jgi:hypothetical protein
MGLGLYPIGLNGLGVNTPVEAASFDTAVSLKLEALFSVPPELENLDFAPPLLLKTGLKFLLALLLGSCWVLLLLFSSKV